MEERLRKFAVLVDAGSYQAAASKLHTSQPGLSVAIQKLERELGLVLLVKGARPLRLTEAGKLAYAQGTSLNTQDQNLRDAMARLQERKPLLRLGCIDSIAALIVRNRWLDSMDETVRFSLQVENSTALLGSLQANEIDLAFTVAQTKIPAMLTQRQLGFEPFKLVCSPRVATTWQDPARRHDIGLLAYNLGSTTERLVHEQLQAQGIALEPRFHSTDPTVLLALAIQGRGIAALPESMVAGHAGEMLTFIKHVGPLVRRIGVMRRTDRNLPEAAGWLTKQVGTMLQKKA